MKSKRTSILAMVLLVAAAGMLYAVGTELSITGTANTGDYCTNGGVVTIAYVVSSTGAADAAVVTYHVDDGADVVLTTIAAGNITDGGGWTFDSRNKTYADSFDVSGLAPGNHTVTVCAEQDGSGGNPNKQDCTDITFFIQSCDSASKCDRNGEVFGQVVGNKNLCKRNSTINFQFKGDFGAVAHLTVTGPGTSTNVVHSVDVSRNGDSCVYNDSWPKPSLAAGSYTFNVTTPSNSNTITDTEQLSCSAN